MALNLDPQSLIQGLLGIQAQQSQLTQNAVEGLQGNFAQVNQLNQESLQMQKDAVLQAGVNAAAKAEVDYKRASLVEDLQRSFNLDPDAANNEISKNLAVITGTQEQYNQERAIYDKMASTDLLSNPIGYLLAQIRMPAQAAKVNALADIEDRARNNIVQQNQMLASSKAAITANTADQEHQNALAEAKNAELAAQAKLKSAEAATMAQQGAQEMQLLQLQSKNLDDARSTITSVSSIAARAEALAEARERRADAAVDRELRRAQLKEILDKKQLEADEENRLNGRLSAVSKTLGLVEPMTMNRLKTLTNKKEQMIWLEAAQTGQLGDDLKTSLEFYLGRGNRAAIQATGGASVYDSAKKMADAGTTYEAEATRQLMAQNMGKAPKREEAIATAFKLYEQNVIGSMHGAVGAEDLSSSKWDKTYNPYRVEFLSFNRAIDKIPELQTLKNNVVKSTIDELVKTGSVTTSNLTSEQQQQVLGGVIAKVRAKQLDPKKAAADIAAYFGTAADFNRQMTANVNFALPIQDAYSFTVQGTFGDDNRKKLNLMDAGVVENGIIWHIKKSEGPQVSYQFPWQSERKTMPVPGGTTPFGAQ
jgi:hypothetical protein